MFASPRDLAETFVFFGVCLAGVQHASWRWIVIGTMLLFILGWPRWKNLIASAGRVDAGHRVRGRYRKAHQTIFVIGTKLLQDGGYLAAMYFFGMGTGWLWSNVLFH